ncbi:MAG: DUF1153 domain-containing protein [Rhodobacteraceae bacterium]|nr:DUF1153 domain-containing protein [Paracoccaceae bacterium]
MYLRKIEGPRTVEIPGGKRMSRADLPNPRTRRWVASRKAAVIRAIDCGLISRDEAMEIYALSDEELDGWAAAVRKHGEKALKATATQKYRQL